MPSPIVALVPLKSPQRGKSRLAPLDAEAREALAEAFARDVLAVLRKICSEVVVVGSDDEARALAEACGCRSVAEGPDLNASLIAAAEIARGRVPGAVVVVVVGDLPALRTTSLADALASLPPGCASFVPDKSGLGTTMYAAPGLTFAPSFGAGSAATHRAAGAKELVNAAADLRLDVDDLADLTAAAALGLGPHTAAVMQRLRLLPTTD